MESWFESDEYPTTPRLQIGLQQSEAHTFHSLPLAENQVHLPRADTSKTRRTAVDEQIPTKARLAPRASCVISVGRGLLGCTLWKLMSPL